MAFRPTWLPERTGVLVATLLGMAVLISGCAPADARSKVSLSLPEAESTSTPLGAEPAAQAATRTVAQKSTSSATPSLGSDLDIVHVMAHVDALATRIGPRRAGSPEEERAAAYVADRLRAAGYSPRTELVALPGGAQSRNVSAVKRGSSTLRVIIGAHIDTKDPSPGANDNASGVAAVLAIAETLADERLEPTVEFVFFGAEEMVDGNPDHHHYGSRHHVASMGEADREKIAAMISVDMIGFGTRLQAVAMPGEGQAKLAESLRAFGTERDVRSVLRLDRSAVGLSDHEAYAARGIPAVCVHWVDDPTYHTAADVAAHLQQERIRVAGQLVMDYVRSFGEQTAEDVR